MPSLTFSSLNKEIEEIKRALLIEDLASRIVDVEKPHPLRVAIDGVDGAGKTSLANELEGPIRRRNRPVIRASIDSFHNPMIVRYRRGRHSPVGYFLDSFNHDALIESLRLPLGPNGSRRFRRAVFDYLTDTEVDAPLETADQDAILLFDGVFVHRPELLPYWDLTIFLDARFDVTIPLTAHRSGGSFDIEAEENRRYVQGQQFYLSECDPMSLATFVIDHNDVENPLLKGN